MLSANLDVKVDTCYRITLVSDDGSRLWVDDALSVDNGGMHPWRIRRDTIALAQGIHDLRLWYYNAVGPCGLAMKVDPIDSSYCTTPAAEIISCISFREDEYSLDAKSKEAIDLTLQQWKPARHDKILITGYADSTGTSSYNDVLSARRAKSVGDYLTGSTYLTKANIEISGKGEVSNLKRAESSCSTDRSVVLKLIKKD